MHLFIFVAAFSLNVVIIALALFLWKTIWVGEYDCAFPKGNYNLPLPLLTDNKKQYKAQTFSEIISSFYTLLFAEYRADYWIKNCGFDAFSYLYMQRVFLNL
jgi:transposase InsO family protein